MSDRPIRRPAAQLIFEPRPSAFRVGLIALATDLTSERDFARICAPRDIAVYVNRIAYANPTTRENLLRMQPGLTEAATILLPGEPLDALAYACTAASVLIGDDAVAAAIRAGKPDVPCITPIGAALEALRRLAARRIALLAPYTAEVTAAVRGFFAAQGVEVLATTCFGLEDDRRMARISPRALVAAAGEACDPEAEALFISCTALRACEVAEEIEARIGRPVVTANQAMIWGTLRAAGYHEPVAGYGRLFRLPPDGGA